MRDHLRVVPNKLGLQIKNTMYGFIYLFINLLAYQLVINYYVYLLLSCHN